MNSQNAPGPGTMSGVQSMHQPIAGPTTSSVPASGSSGGISVPPGSVSIIAPTNEKPAQILTKPRLQDLVREIDPTEQLDEEVEDLLLQLADNFVESTINAACLLTKHRNCKMMEVKDLQLHLERNWNMWIPGFGTDEIKPYKRSTVTEAHKQRLNLIRKSLKKY